MHTPKERLADDSSVSAEDYRYLRIPGGVARMHPVAIGLKAATSPKVPTVQLIGMLDSPYVRRVAISLRLLHMPFEHRSISVFSGFDQFAQINPVVKAPTLVCGDGEVLMDSTLILEYIEFMAPRSLTPADHLARQRALRIVGLSLAACDKTVQSVYEQNLRPAEKQHEPWRTRVHRQLVAAYGAIEAELAKAPLDAHETTITQAGVTTAVAWKFTQMMLPSIVLADRFPRLTAYSASAEQLPAFLATPAS
jgi:glutathione S-transferase